MLSVILPCTNARYIRNQQLTKWLKYRYLYTYPQLKSYRATITTMEWRHERNKMLQWGYFSRYEEFLHCIHNFISNLEPNKKELKSLINLNFKTVGGILILFPNK